MSYGFEEIVTLMNLQDAKLLRAKDKKLDWPKLKKVHTYFIIKQYRCSN